MSRLVKKLARLFMVCVIAAPFLLCGGWYLFREEVISLLKPEIERSIEEKLGYKVSFQSAAVDLFPSPGVTLIGGSAVSVRGCSPWQISEATARIGLRALVKGVFDVRRIEITGLDGALGMVDGSLALVDGNGALCRSLSVDSMPPAKAVSVGPRAPGVLSRVSVAIERVLVRDSRLDFFYQNEKSEVVLKDFDAAFVLSLPLVRIPELSAQGSFDASPFTVRLNELSGRTDQETCNVEDAEVQWGEQSLKLQGAYDGVAKHGRVTVAAAGINLGALGWGVVGAGQKLEGVLKVAADISVDAEEVGVTGSLDLRDVRGGSGEPCGAKSASVSSINLRLHDGRLASLGARVKLNGLSCRDGDDSYSAEQVSGRLDVQQETDLTFSGSFNVRSFGFSDEDTKITKASARLTKITGAMNPRGDVDVGLQLDASSIYLNNPNITITSVDRVEAPLHIRVPASGGYSVSGPVTIADGELVMSGKVLHDASGQVEMLVSSPLKDFVSKDLSANAFAEKVGATTHFSMTHDEYSLRDTVFELGGGTIATQLSLGRRDPKPLQFRAQAEQVAISSLYRALAQQEGRAPLSGTITSFSVSGQGNRVAMPDSLTGSGELRISNAVFQTIDIEGLVRSALAATPLVGSKLVAPIPIGAVEDGGLGGSFTAANGHVSTSNLRVQFSNMTVEGALDADFNSKLSGSVSVVFLEETFRLLGFGLEGLGNFLAREGRVAIPLLIGNTISDPSVEVDLAAIRRFATGVDFIEDAASGFSGGENGS